MSELDKALFIVYTAVLIFSLLVGGTVTFLANKQLKKTEK